MWDRVRANKALGAWFREDCPDLPIASAEKLTAEFVDHWKGVPGSKGVKLDWEATWRNRMRALQERAAERKTRNRPFAEPGSDGWVQPVTPFRDL